MLQKIGILFLSGRNSQHENLVNILGTKPAGSTGNIGPDLDLLKPSLDKIIYVVTNGIGVMQAW